MSSMYETIRELPLFTGIGDEQLSLMLEKTSVEFLKFEDQEVVHSKGEHVRSLDFIINGKLKISYRLDNFPIKVEEVLDAGSVVGALNLYGMNTKYAFDVTSVGKSGLMRISKSQYMNILMSDKIYLMNYLNYLSAAAQKRISIAEQGMAVSVTTRLNTLIENLTSRNARSIEIIGKDEEIAAYCGVSEQDFKDWKENILPSQHFKIRKEE